MLFTIILFAAACVALAACSKEEMRKEPVSLMGYIDIPTTKVSPSSSDLTGKEGDYIPFHWDEGDEVYIYEKGESNYATFTRNGSTSKFTSSDCTFNIVGGEDVYYGATKSAIEAGEIVYTFQEGSFKPFATGTVTVSGGNKSFTIDNFFPVLHFNLNNIDEEADVTVKFNTNSKTYVSCNVGTIGYKEVYFPICKPITGTEDAVEIDWEIEVMTEDNCADTKNPTSILAFNTIYNLPDIEFAVSGDPDDPE